MGRGKGGGWPMGPACVRIMVMLYFMPLPTVNKFKQVKKRLKNVPVAEKKSVPVATGGKGV